MSNDNPRPPLRFLWVWLLAIFMVVLIFRPAVRTVKEWRAQICLTNARKALATGDLDAAKNQCLLALQLRTGWVDAVRVLAQVTAAKKDPATLSLWLYVVQSGKAEDADRLALAETALGNNFINAAGEQVDELLRRPFPAKETYHLAGLLEVCRQRPSLAEGWFLKALAMDPGYTRAEVNLARVELRDDRGRASHKRGLNRLRKIGSRTDEWGIESLRLLAQWGKAHPTKLPYEQNLAAQLRQHPLVEMRDRCLLADWETQTRPGKRDALLKELTSSTSGWSPAAQRDVAVWLNQQGLFEKTLATFPLNPKAPDDLMLAQLDALAGLKRWRELSDFLSKDVLGFQPILRALFRARAARELGNRQIFDMGWQQALRNAGKSANAMRFLCDYAEKLGEDACLAESLEAMSQVPELEMEALAKLVTVYGRQAQTRLLLHTIKRLAVHFPKDTAVLNDLAYLGLLTGDESVRPREKARMVFEQNPRLPAFAVTYALMQLKAGQMAAALKALEPFQETQLALPGWQAVQAAVLAANGRKTEAVKIADRIDRKSLRPEEQQLLSGFWKPR